MAKDKRVEVLFDPDQYSRIEEVASLEGRSVRGVIREAVCQYIYGPGPEKRHQAYVWLTSQEHGPMPDWEDLKDALGRDKYEQIVRSMGLDPADVQDDWDTEEDENGER